ncbi:MAG: NAD(P)H-dependent oxidoreductase subunit E [Sedimentisphaerales bacterium]|nr:NAD(P)H-dependent oxidoreductase subunit E [Sedimentisphaerales bacterium]
MTSPTVDLGYVDQTIERLGRDPAACIPILQALQEHYRYLPAAALRRVCELSDISPAVIAGVSTFYSQFRHHPVGRHIISVCHGTACHVKGADLITQALRRHLRLSPHEDTDAQGLFTLEKVACLGCCTLAPAVKIDEVTYGHLQPDQVGRMLQEFLDWQKQHAGAKGADRTRPDGITGDGEIRLGLGSCCVSRGSGKLHQALLEALRQTGANPTLKRVGCVGMCHQTPLLEVVPAAGRSYLYARVEPRDARAIVLSHFRPKGVARRLRNTVSGWLDSLLTDRSWEPIGRYAIQVRDKPVAAFLDKQEHLATEFCGFLDPTDLAEYEANQGFAALRECLANLAPDQVIDEVLKSGLRGRGGAGFAAGTKWRAVRQAASAAAADGGPGNQPFAVCNGDEGDPGAFMDRMLLESYPYRIIEGMTIAAYAVGARQGYFYIRAEYPLAVQRVQEALERCRQRGYLGDRILDSDFGFDVKIMEGAGAFVCGEETALLASIEGRRGMPHLRPPYPAQQGLWGRPTLVNNVETLALVPWILRRGAEAFARLGTPTSSGTKVFALAGKVARGGLIEVPMGISLREIVEQIGGGIANGRRFKAVQVGGPSGGCVPAHLADLPVNYEALASVGAIMGSGGLVVLDDGDCMVDIARYFLEFTQNQSCGKCTPCRIGTRRMLEILDALCEGRGKPGDLERLESLAETVRSSSLCGLGSTAPNPILSTLRYFRPEYEAHLAGRCPAGRCRALIRYEITEDCIGCTLCAQHCPVNAIEASPYRRHEIDAQRCVRCGTCKSVCPADAVIIQDVACQNT